MRRQAVLREVFRIQCHNEISPASFSAGAKRIVFRIRRDIWESRNSDKFRLFPDEIDYFADDRATDVEAFQNLLVFK